MDSRGADLMTNTIDWLDKVIATYLDGLHNPSDDSLYNELRAERDTNSLKQLIYKELEKQVFVYKNKVELIKQVANNNFTATYKFENGSKLFNQKSVEKQTTESYKKGYIDGGINIINKETI